MERNYNETRYYEAWRNDLNSRARFLAPSSEYSGWYQDFHRGSSQSNDPRHRGVKRQQGKSQREASRPTGKCIQRPGDDYATFWEADMHSRVGIDGNNYHNHE